MKTIYILLFILLICIAILSAISIVVQSNCIKNDTNGGMFGVVATAAATTAAANAATTAADILVRNQIGNTVPDLIYDINTIISRASYDIGLAASRKLYDLVKSAIKSKPPELIFDDNIGSEAAVSMDFFKQNDEKNIDNKYKLESDRAIIDSTTANLRAANDFATQTARSTRSHNEKLQSIQDAKNKEIESAIKNRVYAEQKDITEPVNELLLLRSQIVDICTQKIQIIQSEIDNTNCTILQSQQSSGRVRDSAVQDIALKQSRIQKIQNYIASPNHVIANVAGLVDAGPVAAADNDAEDDNNVAGPVAAADNDAAGPVAAADDNDEYVMVEHQIDQMDKMDKVIETILLMREDPIRNVQMLTVLNIEDFVDKSIKAVNDYNKNLQKKRISCTIMG
jgi:hypothetical protein